MAENNGSTPVTDLVELVSKRKADLKLRLWTNTLDPSTAQSPADFVEADFPGYEPMPGKLWENVVLDAGNRAVALACTWIVAKQGQEPVAAPRGVYLTLPRWEGPELLLAAYPFEDLIPMDQDRQTIRIDAGLGVSTGEMPDLNRHLLRLRVLIFTYLGDVMGTELQGEERRLVQRLLFDLRGLKKRDASIASLSERSTKSRVPAIDPTQPGLQQSFETVEQRLQSLLEL